MSGQVENLMPSTSVRSAKVRTGIRRERTKYILTQKIVKKLFKYKNGILVRKISTSNRVKVGDIAGSPDSNGYLTTSVNGKHYYVHRLIWLIHYGYTP